MSIKVCIAGTTGWTGSVVARRLLASDEFEVVGAIARQTAGSDLGEDCFEKLLKVRALRSVPR